MLKIILISIFFSVSLFSQTMNLSGNWHSFNKSNNYGTVLFENETLTLNSNGTFFMLILVDVQKGDSFIKGLRIEVSGIWRECDKTLSLVLKTLNVPFASVVSGISQASLNNISQTFKNKYRVDTIFLNKIINEEKNGFALKNCSGLITKYHR